MWEGSVLSTSSLAFVAFGFFVDSHFDWCDVISHCSFDVCFSNNEQKRASFHVPPGHPYAFFGEMSIRSSAHFLIWVVDFNDVELHELLVNFVTLSVTSFANIFSQSLGFLFVYCFLCFAKAFGFK